MKNKTKGFLILVAMAAVPACIVPFTDGIAKASLQTVVSLACLGLVSTIAVVVWELLNSED